MNNKTSILALIIAVAALAVVVLRPATNVTSEKKETAFERVMRTHTIRCAYTVYPPYLMIDPNTKKMTGIDYEVTEAIGKAAHLKIDWQEEVGFGSFPEQLRSGKQDVFCVSVWLSAARSQRVEMTVPELYMPLYAFVRDDDTRFDGNLSALNDEKNTVVVVDGSTTQAVAATSFPKAKQLALPDSSDGAQTPLTLSMRKADVMFNDEFSVNEFNKNNPDKKLRRVANVGPVRTFPEVFAVGKGEWELRDILSAAIHELNNSGVIGQILDKYEPVPGAFLRVASPYASPQKP